ncbi:hypothetical protein QTP88_007846 [Uroleucon formosanum]
MPNNSKSVPPLIIPKSRIQSVPNQSPASPSKLNRNDGNTTSTTSKRILSQSSPSNADAQHKKQQHYVSKNRFSLFTTEIDPSEGSDSNQSDMELESNPTDSTPNTIKPPPPIFIRRINNFNSFCTSIKEVTNGENFTCKSSINGVKLSTQSSDSPNNIHHPISILLWNANGLIHQKLELKAFLNLNPVHLLLISEAHLTKNSHCNFPGYTLYQCSHPDGTAHAGSAILIKNNIKHTSLPPYQTDSFQATNIRLTLNNIPTTISSIYCPPRSKINTADFNKFFSSLGNNFIAGGDFNSKHPSWGSRTTNTRGRALNNLISNKALKILSPQYPTYWPSHQNRQPDILDFFISTLPNHISATIKNSADLSSDHSPVILILNDSSVKTKSYPTLTPGNIIWSNFQAILENKITLNIPLKTTLDIDSAILSFTSNIQKAALDSSIVNSTTQKSTSQLPQHISQLIIAKRRARSRWQRSHLPSDKKTYNYFSSVLKNTIRKFNSENYQNYINSLSTTNNSLWKATKNLLKQKNISPPLRYPDNTLAISHLEKANLFASDLESRFTPHPNILDPDHSNHIESSLSQTLPMSLPTKHTSPSEIQYIIKNLANNKSPGHDLITNRIIKRLPKRAIIHLSHIFNSIMRLSYFPPSWKKSIIILIHKPGKPPELPSSYRPISLLPFLAKILEKILLKRINQIISEKKTIPNTQFGFRTNHSALHQVHRIVDNIASTLENKHYCNALFLDVAEAFDRVWHKGLLYKIRFLPAPLFLTIESFLSRRSFQVRFEDELSTIHPINAGVPQGSILAPTLYNLFTSDIPHSNNTTLATFADDTAILSSNKCLQAATNHLQEHLVILQHWFQKWRIKLNENKSTFITFTLGLKNSQPIKLNNSIIQTQNSIKYLGLHLDKRLTWATHIKNKRSSLNLKLHNFRQLLRSNLSLNNKLLIYKQIIRPAMTYGIQIWGTSKNSNINKFQAFQSISLRLLTNSPWYVSNRSLHKDLKIPTISELASNHYKKFHKNTINHPNPLISNLSSLSLPDNPIRRLKRKWPRDLLNT